MEDIIFGIVLSPFALLVFTLMIIGFNSKEKTKKPFSYWKTIVILSWFHVAGWAGIDYFFEAAFGSDEKSDHINFFIGLVVFWFLIQSWQYFWYRRSVRNND